jgi:hypothetical protein
LILDHKKQNLLNEKLLKLNYSPGQMQHLDMYVPIHPIIEDLIAEGLIPPQQEELSFELNNKSLIVNGKKQPAEMHEKFKNKYIKKDSHLFKYSRKNGSTSTTINID